MNEFEKEYFKILKLDKKDDEFLKSIKKWPKNIPLPAYDFKSNFDEYIVNEDKNVEVNIGQSALGYIKSCLRKDILIKVDNEKLKNKILSSWKYYNDFCIACIDVSLWILEIDFNNIQNADRYIKKIDPNFSKKIGKNNGSYGLTIPLNDNKYIILFDYNSFKNEKNLQHEFTHYVQLTTNKLIQNNEELTKKLKKYINIDPELLEYICNPFEFWTHIYVDIFNNLQKIYWLKFKNAYDWKTFIDVHFNDLKNNIFNLKNSAIVKLWLNNINNNLYYFLIIAGISFINKDLFDKIKTKLKNEDI